MLSPSQMAKKVCDEAGVSPSSTIIIELFAPDNASVVFKPLRKPLRGAYRRDALSDVARGLPYPDIPGKLLWVNVAAKKCGVSDPLRWREYDGLRDQVLAAANKRGVTIAQSTNVAEDEYRSTVDPNRLATWWYHMKVLCDRGYARLLNGDFVKQPAGQITVDFTATDPFVHKPEVGLAFHGTPKTLADWDTFLGRTAAAQAQAT